MKFINDLINLTQGQLLVKYWWLWLIVLASTFVFIYAVNRNAE